MPKFKIYTHQYQFLKISVKKTGKIFLFFYYIGFFVLKFFLLLAKTAFNAVLKTGKLLLKFFIYARKSIVNEFLNTGYFFKKRLNLLVKPGYFQSLIIFLLIAGLGYGLISVAKLAALGFEAKNSILLSSEQGAKFLDQAEQSLKNQDLEKANLSFLMAYKSFENGQAKLEQAASDLAYVTDLMPQTREAKNILQIAGLISTSGKDFISLYKTASELKFTAAGLNVSSQEVWPKLNSLIENINNNLKTASALAEDTNPKNLPKKFSAQFDSAKNSLFELQSAFSNFEKIFQIFYALHSGKHNVLLLFQNNNELRTTGGFLGTFGAMVLNNGRLDTLKVSSIYDLDGQLTENISPPTPILNVNPRWYLRDSNWFADYPQSAKIMSGFYEKEGGESPDLIVALTPDLIMDLLKITGPISLPKYNLTLDSENFFEHIQVASSISYQDITPGQPKQVLADFMPVMLQKLGELSAESWPAVFEALQKNLNQKNILLYSRITQIQKTFEEFNWSGRVLNSDRDYLQISSSNLGGTKSDLYVTQDVKLHTVFETDGSITQELEITRSNHMPKNYNTYNSSYLRIFVPLGSTLLSNSGFDAKILENQKKPDYKTDPDVYQWEKKSVKDILTGTIIGQEASKTFFGNWMDLEGGETKIVKLTYRLPFKLADIDRYSLLLQKQPGVEAYNFGYFINIGNRSVIWKNFDENPENQTLKIHTALNQDRFWGMVIQK